MRRAFLWILVVLASIMAGALGWSSLKTLTGPEPLPLSEKMIDAQIARYVEDHPGEILASLQKFLENTEKAKSAAAEKTFEELRPKIFDNPADPVLGNEKGDVTIVEFFDYRCPYCKRVSPDIDALLATDGNIRLVLKEFPILGPESEFAAKLALAAMKQNHYAETHRALMAQRGDFSESALMDLAKQAGLDIPRLESDLRDPAIMGAIEANIALGKSIAISGTPAFVIGAKIIPGALSKEELAKLVAEARESPAPNP